MDWNKVRESVIFTYGEPIYEEDFPQIDVRDGFALCPVCEEEFC